MQVTKDSIIGDILDQSGRTAAPFFLEMGMHCLGCPHSLSETVEEACQVHGTDAADLVDRLNAAIASAAGA